jgi:tetratricopeptide (TPR) repeat protein
MKRTFALLLALLPALLFAQGAGKIEDAALYFSEQNYEATVTSARAGLGFPELKPRVIAKGNKLFAQGVIMSYSEAFGNKNAQYKKFLETQPVDILLEAYKALGICETNDPGKTFAEEVNVSYSQLMNMLLNKGYDIFRSGDAKTALPYLDATVACMKRVQKPFYTAYQVRGYINLDLKDSLKALEDFEAALILYNQPPAAGQKKNEDKSAATIYGQAVLLKKWKKDYNGAMTLLAEAQSKFPGNADLKKYEIILFQNPAPDFYETALARFDKLLTENPNDTLTMLVYATLLERKDPDKAIDIYRKLLAITPSNLTAIFNIGALYNNKAKDVTDQYNELVNAKSKDSAKMDALEKKIEEYFTLALPYFESAIKLEPENVTVLNVLIQITGQLRRTDETEKYIARRKEVRGY